MPDTTKPLPTTAEQDARARAIIEKVSYTKAEWDEAERIRKLLADAMARVPTGEDNPNG